MKILLVKPQVPLKVARSFYAFLHLEPLDLEIVAAGVPAGHDVRLTDLSLPSGNPEKRLRVDLASFRPDVVGFTGYSNQAGVVKLHARTARSILPSARIVVGGIHATIAPEDFKMPGIIDTVVRGEGATAMRRIVASLENGTADTAKEEAILSVADPDFDVFANRPPPVPPDWSGVPRARRDLVDRSRYFYVDMGYPGARLDTLFPRVASMKTSFGCPHRCSFCAVNHMNHGRYTQREPDDVVGEIAELDEPVVYFTDDEMFCNRDKAMRMAEGLIARGIRKRYISWARSDTICRNPELFAAWKKAGLSVVHVGIESMQEENLEGYNKGATPETNRKAVETLRELGIGLHASLMVNQDFGEEDFLKVHETIRFIGTAQMTFTVFSPPPGTPLWAEKKKDFICPDPYAFYDCMHTLLPTALPLGRFYRYFSMLYLLSFRRNPWRVNRVKAPLRDTIKLLAAGARCGAALRSIPRDYPRSLR